LIEVLVLVWRLPSGAGTRAAEGGVRCGGRDARRTAELPDVQDWRHQTERQRQQRQRRHQQTTWIRLVNSISQANDTLLGNRRLHRPTAEHPPQQPPPLYPLAFRHLVHVVLYCWSQVGQRSPDKYVLMIWKTCLWSCLCVCLSLYFKAVCRTKFRWCYPI